jgi:hypothetical protein
VSETLQIWLFAGAFGMIGVLFALWWHHAVTCRKTGEDIAVIKAILVRIETDIGTHETGLRGQVHKLACDIAPYVIRSQQGPKR